MINEPVAILKKSTVGAILDRTLIVYELKFCLKAELWDSGFRGWHSRKHKPIEVRKFYFNQSPDLATICRHFGFSIQQPSD